MYPTDASIKSRSKLEYLQPHTLALSQQFEEKQQAGWMGRQALGPRVKQQEAKTEFQDAALIVSNVWRKKFNSFM